MTFVNLVPYFERALGKERYARVRESGAYEFAVDTTASLLFWNAMNAANEMLVAGYSFENCLESRLAGSVMNVLTARPYAKSRDWLYQKFGLTKESTGVKKALVDTISMTAFAVPIYFGVAKVIGVPDDQAKKAAEGLAVMCILGGRPYGWFLDNFRESFGLERAGASQNALYESD